MNNAYEDFYNGVVAALSDCEDFVCRESGVTGARFCLMYIKGITARDYISERLLRPMMIADMKKFDGNFGELIESPVLMT
ncbi:MAG: hypothetical protein J6Q89_06150, partial [Clostridia bacterium]|nr:hypothetical protein [Clostridia bacterium]